MKGLLCSQVYMLVNTFRQTWLSVSYDTCEPCIDLIQN